MAAIIGALARAAGRALMPGLFKSGLSPNAIYKKLRFDYKLSWRRQDMFKDIRQVTGLMKHERQWVNYPTHQKPHRFLFSDVDLPAGRNYRLYVNVDYQNTLTGDHASKLMSFYIDDFEDLDDAMKQWLDYKEESQYNSDEIIEGWTFLTGEHNRGAPW